MLTRGRTARVPGLALTLAGILAAGAGRGDDGRSALLRPDPALPSLASVEAVGAAARGEPKKGSSAAQPFGDRFVWTQGMVNIYRKQSLERLGTAPLRSLAHQWGRTQILLDYLRRYDALLVQVEAGDADWDGDLDLVLRALRSASFGVEDDAPDKYEQLALALPGGRGSLAGHYRRPRRPDEVHPNLLLRPLYPARGDVAASRAAVAEARRQLRIRSLQLEDYARQFLARWRGPAMRSSPEAVRILETRARR